MGKRRRKRDPSVRPGAADVPLAERIDATRSGSGTKPLTRFEDKLTVFWMLTTLFTLATMALGFGATIFDASRDASPQEGARIVAVGDYARFATAVTSLMLLAATPIVLKVRQVAPPRAITIFVVAVATVGLAWAFLSGPGVRTSARARATAGLPSSATDSGSFVYARCRLTDEERSSPTGDFVTDPLAQSKPPQAPCTAGQASSGTPIVP